MNELLTILRELHPDIDFETATGLVEDSVLTSLDIVTIVTEVADRLDVNIPAEEILPENFDSAAALWQLIQRLDEA
ncbi:MAG: acyl carrier protein [Clostridiales bacterium]|nr:acyl carrier protein [Clostridiales bacterium]MCI5886795.1 acyl carrier protein [Oscillospiraceae bacterium]MDY3924087.1 acyl carrier protein [Eubacteriales bacterium]UKI12586.1 MAG: acyl carrier protein [Oscillospiraceae bacterium]